MSWTKKDYELVAGVIASERGIISNQSKESTRTLDRLTLRFAETFHKDSPNFKRARFLEACGF